MSFISILISIVPFILIGTYYYQKDTQKEPNNLLQKLFILGILSGLAVVIISLFGLLLFPNIQNIENANVIHLFFYTFLFIAMIEEGCKFLVIYKTSYNIKDFDQWYDIILYSVFVSLGFACFENFLYLFSSNSKLWTVILRSITAIPAHACFQTFMGYHLALSKFNEPEKRKKQIALSIIIPIILHGLYNFLIFSQNTLLTLLFFVFLILMFLITLLRIKDTVEIDQENINNSKCPYCHLKIIYNYCEKCGYKKQ